MWGRSGVGCGCGAFGPRKHPSEQPGPASGSQPLCLVMLPPPQASGRLENIVGWYHSHPGYGCWLSGIDVGTQSTNQKYQVGPGLLLQCRNSVSTSCATCAWLATACCLDCSSSEGLEPIRTGMHVMRRACAVPSGPSRQTAHGPFTTLQEPFLAIVVDPHRTVAAGKVEIGAFRTFPEVCVCVCVVGSVCRAQRIPVMRVCSCSGTAGVQAARGGPWRVPDHPAGQDRGLWGSLQGGGSSADYRPPALPAVRPALTAHAAARSTVHPCVMLTGLPHPACTVPPVPLVLQYYSLDISFFKSSLDSHLLDLLWNKVGATGARLVVRVPGRLCCY